MSKGVISVQSNSQERKSSSTHRARPMLKTLLPHSHSAPAWVFPFGGLGWVSSGTGNVLKLLYLLIGCGLLLPGSRRLESTGSWGDGSASELRAPHLGK